MSDNPDVEAFDRLCLDQEEEGLRAAEAQDEALRGETAEEAVEEEFAVVEIFGHRRHCGRVMEVERFGATLLRVDVPVDGDFDKGYTSHFYGGAAIFSFTPSDRASVERANRPCQPPRPMLMHPDDDDFEDASEMLP